MADLLGRALGQLQPQAADVGPPQHERQQEQRQQKQRQRTDNGRWLLGLRYPPDHPESGKDPNFLQDHRSRLWMTYRMNFPSIDRSEYRSDTGWGCMLRSAQMILAQGLITHYLGRSWRLPENPRLPNDPDYLKVLKLFFDYPAPFCPFSIHNMLAHSGRFGRAVGEWFGPETSCQMLRECRRMVDPLVLADLPQVYVATAGQLCLPVLAQALGCADPLDLELELGSSSLPTSSALGSPVSSNASSSLSPEETDEEEEEKDEGDQEDECSPRPNSSCSSLSEATPSVVVQQPGGDQVSAGALAEPDQLSPDDVPQDEAAPAADAATESNMDPSSKEERRKDASADAELEPPPDLEPATSEDSAEVTDDQQPAVDGGADEAEQAIALESPDSDHDHHSDAHDVLTSAAEDAEAGSDQQRDGQEDERKQDPQQPPQEQKPQAPAQPEDSVQPMIIFLPMRLGMNNVNPIYTPALLQLLALPQCLGLIGGRPRSSLYFVGTHRGRLLYLDPHTVQDVPKMNWTRQAELRSFHCSSVAEIAVSAIDPSLVIGFYCADRGQLRCLWESLEEVQARVGVSVFPFALLREPPAQVDLDSLLDSGSDSGEPRPRPDSCEFEEDSEEDFVLL